jgi:acyl-coenzyme A thioesterase PaaI-like protein
MKMQTNKVELRKMRFKLFLLGFFKIPLIWFVRPKLIHISEKEVEILIKLRRRSKNHLNSMYFGALAIGADLAGGIQAFYFADKNKIKISFAFKGLQAEFLKRAETDVTFKCSEGNLIKETVEKSIQQKERINQEIKVNAFNTNNELVATFELILSLKVID